MAVRCADLQLRVQRAAVILFTKCPASGIEQAEKERRRWNSSSKNPLPPLSRRRRPLFQSCLFLLSMLRQAFPHTSGMAAQRNSFSMALLFPVVIFLAV